ncbi:DnaB helicase C-terminal domain-containing protein [Sporosarcina luteola]|uniref:DnaB helicase C-terminal domain-containing protein n=1 Tax=Sporosarcina luteola TaxID=582850 RepID=UPI0020424F4D|nr:DnaB helicase C-terminal domain-containing protein [Sporosarcina luteola]MCM3638922.1 DnaB helicase C-terminal domain-containing protein [Sporosarcina luteola]
MRKNKFPLAVSFSQTRIYIGDERSGQYMLAQLELIVSKNRNGPVGTAYAAYNKFTGEVIGIGTDSERAIS